MNYFGGVRKLEQQIGGFQIPVNPTAVVNAEDAGQELLGEIFGDCGGQSTCAPRPRDVRLEREVGFPEGQRPTFPPPAGGNAASNRTIFGCRSFRRISNSRPTEYALPRTIFKACQMPVLLSMPRSTLPSVPAPKV